MEVFSQQPFKTTTFDVKTGNGCDYEYVSCFPCSVCNECLKEKEYFELNYKKYCFTCFVKLYAEKCVFCQKSIYGRSPLTITCYDNKVWHGDCFKCRTCEKSLTECGFVQEDSKCISCSYCGTKVKF